MLSVCLSVHLLSVHFSICMSVCVQLFVCLIRPSIHLHIYLSVPTFHMV
jgi:hypothetical protein